MELLESLVSLAVGLSLNLAVDPPDTPDTCWFQTARTRASVTRTSKTLTKVIILRAEKKGFVTD